MPQLADLTAQYGEGAALAVDDADNVLGAAYHPAGLTVLLVYSDATARSGRTCPRASSSPPRCAN